jgi:hypothetical protein
MGMLEGCLPAFGLSNTSFIYDELFPPQSYGVMVEEDQLRRLPELVDGMVTSTGRLQRWGGAG